MKTGVMLAKYRRKPLEKLAGEYEFLVIGDPIPGGPTDEEFNRIEIRMTPDLIYARYEHAPEWAMVSWDALTDMANAFKVANAIGFRDGQLEALSRQGLKPIAVKKTEGQ